MIILEDISKELGVKVEVNDAGKVTEHCQISDAKDIKTMCQNLSNVFKPHMKELNIPVENLSIQLNALRDGLVVRAHIAETDTLKIEKSATNKAHQSLVFAEYGIFPKYEMASLKNLFICNTKLKGRRIAASLLKHIAKTHYNSGINRVELLAGDKNGPFVWPKYGFMPNSYAMYEIEKSYQENKKRFKSNDKKFFKDFFSLPSKKMTESFLKLSQYINKSLKAQNLFEKIELKGAINFKNAKSRALFEKRVGIKLAEISAAASIKKSLSEANPDKCLLQEISYKAKPSTAASLSVNKQRTK